MGKIKLTKTALKQERDSLKQFQRFLPTLQLKKQQLQLEMRTCLERIESNEQREARTKEDLSGWIILFGSESVPARIGEILKIREVIAGSQNIAGVNVPVFERVDFEGSGPDLYHDEPWFDDAVEAVKNIISIRAERDIIRKQYDLIEAELRVTTQRVNLFEKVMIPECKENIRKIQIYIGDQNTAAVARSKIAKKKLQETVA